METAPHVLLYHIFCITFQFDLWKQKRRSSLWKKIYFGRQRSSCGKKSSTKYLLVSLNWPPTDYQLPWEILQVAQYQRRSWRTWSSAPNSLRLSSASGMKTFRSSVPQDAYHQKSLRRSMPASSPRVMPRAMHDTCFAPSTPTTMALWTSRSTSLHCTWPPLERQPGNWSGLSLCLMLTRMDTSTRQKWQRSAR